MAATPAQVVRAYRTVRCANIGAGGVTSREAAVSVTAHRPRPHPAIPRWPARPGWSMCRPNGGWFRAAGVRRLRL